MRTFLSLLCIFLTAFCFMQDVQAKRFGGGKSFGMQRSSTQYSRSATSAGQNVANRASKWVAPLLGLAAGAMLANLFMGNGLGSAILSWLVIGVALFFIIGLIKRLRGHQPNQPVFNHINQHTQASNDIRSQPVFPLGGSQGAATSNFHGDTFLREAKALFIRLQAAYDQKNVNDLRKFTTPDVFAEVQLQLQERGEQPNHTEVLSLNAQILNVTDEPQITIHGEVMVTTVSVRFTGSVKEDGQTDHLNEVWHFQKAKSDLDWSVAGLQQE